ncbi:MAG TPA: sugar phosphate isomerase/epimerase family protein [Candidatus Sulfotelmatobacter sp.]|nr:sugar phosphate isomerase/epimerase family protein [Candidatus Sulfotelmatobacter sp.]
MTITRREFLATGAATVLASRFLWGSEGRLPLAFSTLGCPAWEWRKILEFAQGNGFAAIELRGLMGSMDLPSSPEFAPGRIAQTKKQVADHGLKISDLGSSSQMHVAEAELRAKQIDDARRFIDLASALEVPYVRVFGNEIHGPREEVIARVADGLHQLGEYAGSRGVTVIIESHGDFVDSPTLKEVLARADSKHVALLWDAHHTFADGHEQPEQTVAELGGWIRHTHLKDSVPDGKGRKYVLTGKGDVPVERQVLALRKMGYRGYYCFEWEKVWHPDLQEPEVAFPDYARVVGGYLKEPLRKVVSYKFSVLSGKRRS